MNGAYTVLRMRDGQGRCALNGEFEREKIPAPHCSLNEAEIASYVWGGDYMPKAYARVGWNSGGLYVLMYAFERTIRADVREFNGRVCEDSCLEFFLMPNPEADARYVNIEVNAAGVGHIGIGGGRGNREKPPAPPSGFSLVNSDHTGGWWAVSYALTKEFLEGEFGKCVLPGQIMRGNFYKCDESIHPHFGSHFPVKSEKPDFHRPESFGEIVLAP